ncbi:HAD family hydrolase [Helicobacter jaachi]|uniref:phosphoglycolate phosphatase n=1 Tax=Helicobacter jaachi TaxID=1677920 RepID=A0A4U8TFP6_9HELI|nr:HAD family hydrolase [Helicobacter jaachi]TLD97517.1 HAD family hydrolase [Helicobacter jaachi]
MKQHIVLFDLDGTLIDSTQAIYESFCKAYEAMGQTPPSFEQTKACIGHTLENMFLQNNVTSFNVDKYVNHYRIYYRALMESGTHLLTHAKEAIIEAYNFAYLGIVTTKRGDFSQILLEKLGVWEYFETIVGIESVSSPKPHPQPILMALQQFPQQARNIPKDRIYMIGDTPLDIQAAQEAGINPIGVLCGFGKKEDMQAFGIPLYEHTLQAVQAIAQKCSI